MNLQELRTIAVLQSLNDDVLTRLSAVLEERVFADGETLFAEGEPGAGMYFIGSGAVRIVKRTGDAESVQKTLAVLEAGDYCGEMSLFDQKPRSAAAVAAGRTQALWLSKVAFDALSRGGGQDGLSVLFAMIRTSGDRIRRLNAQVIVYDEIGKAIGESRELTQLLDVVLDQLCRATLADWGMVVLQAQFSDRRELCGSVNVQLTPAQKEDLATGNGFIALAEREGRDRLVRNFMEEEQFKSCARLGFESAAMLLVPVLVGNRSLGLIVLGGVRPDQFDLNDLNLTRGVARQTAQAILNARHREEEQARARHAKQFVRF
jgi:CRP-like cAMP-binding protein